VHIDLRILGYVVIDDVGDTIDVQATGGHVSGDKYRGLVITELLQDLLPLGLGKVAVQGTHAEAVGVQAFGDDLHHHLGLHEDHGLGLVGVQDAA